MGSLEQKRGKKGQNLNMKIEKCLKSQRRKDISVDKKRKEKSGSAKVRNYRQFSVNWAFFAGHCIPVQCLGHTAEGGVSVRLDEQESWDLAHVRLYRRRNLLVWHVRLQAQVSKEIFQMPKIRHDASCSKSGIWWRWGHFCIIMLQFFSFYSG